MKILAFNCSTNLVSISISSNENILADAAISNFKTENLIFKIDELLSNCQIKKNELNLIATATGPGGYTSLRSAVATANSLALALNIPLVGIDTLYGLAWQNRSFQGLIIPILKARADENNVAIYGSNNLFLNSVLENTPLVTSQIIEKLNKIEGPFLICGDEAQSIYDQLAKNSKAILAPLNTRLPNSLALNEIALATPTENYQKMLVPNYSHQPNINTNTKKRIN